MASAELPLLIEPQRLVTLLDNPDIIVVDLCKHETYLQAHIPGAVHLDYKLLVAARPPAMGFIPEIENLGQIMADLGFTNDSHVVAYDDEGGGKAARFTYTLDVLGHEKYSLLNGGLHAWTKEGCPLDATPTKRSVSVYKANIHSHPIATKQYILSKLYDNSIQLIDARSPSEYYGVKKFAEKIGHIPGAINLDWNELIDQQHNFRLKPPEELTKLINDRNIEQSRTTVVYCQTHHRSALLYFVLKYLGYTNIKGYPGSWSEWGNSSDTPVEVN